MTTLDTLIRVARYPTRWLCCPCGSTRVQARESDNVCLDCGQIHATARTLVVKQ